MSQLQIEVSLQAIREELQTTLNEFNEALEQISEIKNKMGLVLDEHIVDGRVLLAQKSRLLVQLEDVQRQYQFAVTSDESLGQEAVAALRLEKQELTEKLAVIQKQLQHQNTSLEQRFDEIAKLTRLLLEQEEKTRVTQKELTEVKAHLSAERKQRKELKEAYHESQRELKIAWKKRKLVETERDELKQLIGSESIHQDKAQSVQDLQLRLENIQVQNKKLEAELEQSQQKLKTAWKKCRRAETLLAEQGLLPRPAHPGTDGPITPIRDAEVMTLTSVPEVSPSEPAPAVPEVVHLIEYIAVAEQVMAIRSSGLFDEGWYLSTYSDVAKAGIDPVEHFVKYGWLEGRNPSRLFNTEDYVSLHPEVLDSALNPLMHFIRTESVVRN